MVAVPRVLIVDESADSREVLRELLARQGATTIESPRPEEAVQLVDLHRPHLIVLDAESDRSPSGRATDVLRALADRTDTPVVILGSVRRRRGQNPGGQFVAKPYHYGNLIRKIEDLLASA